MGVSHIEEEDSGDWMTKMLQSDLFARLPMANIQQLFAFLEPVAYEKGDAVIKQGDPGDNYYIIQEGTCEVARVPGEGKKSVKLGEMTVGDSFGEESLLTDSTRNATVTMLTDGIMMQLNKDNFVELIKKPSLSSVSFDQATAIVNEGGEWIDVRFAKEFEVSHIEASTNIPLNLLRIQMDKFNHDLHYVLYCDTGGRSSSAAFLLTQNGFQVSYLEGGLESNPAAGTEQVTATDAAPAAEQATQEKAVEEVVEKLEQTIDNVDSAVKASVLEADLAKNKMVLEATEKKQKEESEQGDEWQLDARIIKWKPPVYFAGLDSLYRLERISGRYRDVEEEKTENRTVYSLSENRGLDIWSITKNHPSWVPWVDAYYGSATYLPMNDGARFKITLSQTGLLARPVNEAGEESIQFWD